uniref:Uncharacterized protein n=1 Tax=Timema shepardi TaxID=629360 RepID=A0A7R9AKG5_TIMSH|nr:unnamed protein product [Timema shepardi]
MKCKLEQFIHKERRFTPAECVAESSELTDQGGDMNDMSVGKMPHSTALSGKIPLSTPHRDSNLDLPIICSLVYCKSGALDHAATEAAVELNTTSALANYATEAGNLEGFDIQDSWNAAETILVPGWLRLDSARTQRIFPQHDAARIDDRDSCFHDRPHALLVPSLYSGCAQHRPCIRAVMVVVKRIVEENPGPMWHGEVEKSHLVDSEQGQIELYGSPWFVTNVTYLKTNLRARCSVSIVKMRGIEPLAADYTTSQARGHSARFWDTWAKTSSSSNTSFGGCHLIPGNSVWRPCRDHLGVRQYIGSAELIAKTMSALALRSALYHVATNGNGCYVTTFLCYQHENNSIDVFPLANALVVLSSTAENREIKVRISVGRFRTEHPLSAVQLDTDKERNLLNATSRSGGCSVL